MLFPQNAKRSTIGKKKNEENRYVSFLLLDAIFHIFHVDLAQQNSLLSFFSNGQT